MEASASIELAKHVLLAAGVVLAAGILSGFVAQKLRVPDVVVLLMVGMLLGPAVSGLIHIKADSALNRSSSSSARATSCSTAAPRCASAC